MINTEKVTRIEVIDFSQSKNLDDLKGRVYTNWDDNNKVELSLQDQGRTLKIFIKRRDE